VQRITGRFVSKSLIKSGESEFGKWKIINFLIEKTYNKKKYKIYFVAKGKWADFVETIPVKERITIHYIPECKEYAPNKWATDLKAIEIEKYVPAKKLPIYVNNEMVNRSEFEMEKDLQLPLNNDKKEEDNGL
jgi:hypothetical protein